MTKGWKQRRAEQEAARRARALAAGETYALSWSTDYSYGPQYFKTLQEAEEMRDRMIDEYGFKIPIDYYDRQATLTMLHIRIEHYDAGSFREVPDTARECPWRVDYHDGREPRSFSRR